MSIFTYDVGYADNRNRLTVAFRYILAIPHLIIAGAWSYFAELLAVVQWFFVVFTGQRNEGIWNMQKSFLEYYARVYGYLNLLFDPYPAFASSAGPAPVSTNMAFESSANRLSNGLRLFWAIPALLLTAVLTLVAGVVGVIVWFTILFTGKHPRGMWDFQLKVLRLGLQTQSYVLLMTDTYPKFGAGEGGTVPMGGPQQYAPQAYAPQQYGAQPQQYAPQGYAPQPSMPPAPGMAPGMQPPPPPGPPPPPAPPPPPPSSMPPPPPGPR